jgi:hypothetical protein
MKLSNKILLGFFSFIFLYMTAAFTELRLNGTPNVIDKKNSISETVDLTGIAYLNLIDVSREVNVTGGDAPMLEIRSFAGDQLKNLKYKISGDTLTLSGFESDDTRTVKISVLVPNSALKGIIINSSTLIIEELKQDVLNISGSKGRIWMSGNIMEKIKMDLSDLSSANISGTVLDTLSTNLEQSQVHLSSPVGLLEGSITNKSLLELGEIGEIKLKKDESSKLAVYLYLQ